MAFTAQNMSACAVEVYIDTEYTTGESFYQLKRTERFGQAFADELLAVAGVKATFLTYEGKGFLKGLYDDELTQIASVVLDQQPATLVVMLGFNDANTPDTTSKWRQLQERIQWFLSLGATNTVFVLPDDSDRVDASLIAEGDRTVHFVCAALGHAGVCTTTLSFAHAEPSSAQAADSCRVDRYHFTAAGVRALLKPHAAQLAAIGGAKDGTMVVVVDSSYTSHDYKKVALDSRRVEHPDYPGRTFDVGDYLRWAARHCTDFNEIECMVQKWMRESVVVECKNETFALVCEERRVHISDDQELLGEGLTEALGSLQLVDSIPSTVVDVACF